MKVGQRLKYTAGQGDWHVEAEVEVSREPGTTGCYVTILSYTHKGSAVEHNIGDEIIAGARELSFN